MENELSRLVEAISTTVVAIVELRKELKALTLELERTRIEIESLRTVVTKLTDTIETKMYRDLKSYEDYIKSIIQAHGTISLTELRHKSTLSDNIHTEVVRSLIRSGEVVVTKADGNGRGRRRTLLSIANSKVRKH